MDVLIGVVVGWLACGAFGYYVARAKGRPGSEGVLFGLLLGPLGLLLVVLLPAGAGASPRSSIPPHERRGYVPPREPRRTNPASVAMVVVGAVVACGLLLWLSR